VNWYAYAGKFFQNLSVGLLQAKNAKYGVISVSTRNMSAIFIAILGVIEQLLEQVEQTHNS